MLWLYVTILSGCVLWPHKLHQVQPFSPACFVWFWHISGSFWIQKLNIKVHAHVCYPFWQSKSIMRIFGKGRFKILIYCKHEHLPKNYAMGWFLKLENINIVVWFRFGPDNCIIILYLMICFSQMLFSYQQWFFTGDT